MDRFDALRVFVRIVETGSFTKAAAVLQLPRSTVSTVLQELEGRLGARLLQRTTRRVTLTHDGAAFYERSLRLVADMEDAETLFRHGASQPRGRLRIDVPGRIARRVVAPALPDFFARYPEIELEMGATDRTIDLVHEGVDCALRVGELNASSLVARPLGALRLVSCASPAYLARHGTPRTPADLTNHLAIGYASPSSGRADSWEHVEAGQVKTMRLHTQVSVDSAEGYIACCLAGLGLIQIPAYDVRADIAAGRLVEVLPDYRAAPMPIAIVYPHRRHLSRRLQVFIDWLAKLCADRILCETPRFPGPT